MKFDSAGSTESLKLKDRLFLMNPNKYLFPFSSAPMSVVDGVPKFTIEAGSGDGSAAKADADKVTNAYKVGQTHGGVTFNRDANKGSAAARNVIKTRFHTSKYDDLVRSKRYEKNLKMNKQ